MRKVLYGNRGFHVPFWSMINVALKYKLSITFEKKNRNICLPYSKGNDVYTFSIDRSRYNMGKNLEKKDKFACLKVAGTVYTHLVYTTPVTT